MATSETHYLEKISSMTGITLEIIDFNSYFEELYKFMTMYGWLN